MPILADIELSLRTVNFKCEIGFLIQGRDDFFTAELKKARARGDVTLEL